MSSPVEMEFYDLLGVDPSCSQTDIKKAYRKKALQMHPDKGGDEETFKKINIAYEILSDEEKREMYNKYGKDGLKNSGQIPEDILSRLFGGMFGNGNIRFNMSEEHNEGFGDDLNGMFGLFKNIHKAVTKPQPIIYPYKVSIEDICTRKVCKLKITREKICKPCIQNSTKCNFCDGRGFQMKTRQIGLGMFQQTQIKCEKCIEGYVYISCEKCQNGIINEKKVLELYLTPEMNDGYKYVFEGEGNENKKGLQGDFIVILNYKEHKDFKVLGKNLIYKKEISLKQALCGHEFFICHPSGENISVLNNEIIEPNTVQYLPKGISEGGKMEIHYNIIFPKKLTEIQKKVLEETLI